MTPSPARRRLAAALATAFMAIAHQPAGAQAEPSGIAATQANLGLRLLPLLAPSGSNPNLTVSPASLAAVLSFLDVGASPAMHGAIAAALGLPADGADAALDATRAGAKELADLPKDAPLAFANAVFVDDGISLKPDAAARLKALGAEMASVDLAAPSGIASINAWVKDKTAGLIPTILSDPLPDSGLAAVNALHFKDAWRLQFDARSTKPALFQLAAGGTKTVPMMHLSSEDLPLRLDDKLVAVALPYKTKRYSLIVVAGLGPPSGPGAYTATGEWLTGDAFTNTRINLSLPKFSVTFEGNLIDNLNKLGLAAGHSNSAFPGLADLLDLTDVIQKTLIKVDENGTEAAAATVGVANLTAAQRPVKTVNIVIDKPFVFALRDDKTGFVLLTGYIGDPTAK